MNSKNPSLHVTQSSRSSAESRARLARKALASFPLEQRLMFDADVAKGAEDLAHREGAADMLPTELPSLRAVLTQLPQEGSGLLDTGTPSVAAPHEIALVDTSVADWQVLVSNIRAGVEVILLDPAGDELAQIRDALAGREGLDAIHLISHGSEGTLTLGGHSYAADSLEGAMVALDAIGAALASDGDFLLYGCDIAGGDAGLRLIGRLAEATSADVAASADTTGTSRVGGNWSLETTTGAIDTRIALTDTGMAEYDNWLSATPLDGSTGWVAIMFGLNQDPVGDSQAGAADTDIVGDATHGSLYVAFDDNGTSGTGDDTIAFRIRIDNPTGLSTFNGVAIVGIDANLDGRVDLFLSIDGRNNTQAVRLLDPGTGANSSPSTTTTSPLPAGWLPNNGVYPFTAANYSVVAVSSTTDPHWTGDADLGNDGKTDVFVSFRLPLADLAAVLAKASPVDRNGVYGPRGAMGIQGFNKDTIVQYVNFTQTQPGPINGDLNGVGPSYDRNATFGSIGAFTAPMSASNPVAAGPGVLIATPISGGMLNATEDGSVDISGTTQYLANKALSLTVTDGVHTVTGSTTTAANGTWTVSSLNLSGMNEGTLSVTATVDPDADAGTDNSVSAQASVLHDRTPPVVTIDQLATTTDGKRTFSGTSDLPDGSIITVTLDSDNNAATANLVYQVVVTSGAWTLPTATLAPVSGTMPAAGVSAYTKVTASATDAAGNSSTAIALNHPTVTSQSTNSTAPVVTGTWTNLGTDTLRVEINGAIYSPTLSSNTWSVDLATAVPVSGTLGAITAGNSYEVVARVTRGAGLVEDLSSGELTITNTPVVAVGIDGGDTVTTLDTTPTITGTSQNSGGFVIVRLDPGNDGDLSDAVTYSVTPNGAGIWNLDTGAATPISGTRPAAGFIGDTGVYATDSQGRVHDAQVITVTSPVVAILGITSASATNASAVVSNTGGGQDYLNMTEDDSVTITGTGTANMTVDLLISDPNGNFVSYTGVAIDGTGQWSVSGKDLSALDNGVLEVSATLSGTAIVATDTSVTHDKTAPLLFNTSQSTIEKNAGAVIKGSTDLPSGTGITVTVYTDATYTTVQTYNPGSVNHIYTTTVQADGTWSVTTTGSLGSGATAYIRVKTTTANTTDAAGNIALPVDKAQAVAQSVGNTTATIAITAITGTNTATSDNEVTGSDISGGSFVISGTSNLLSSAITVVVTDGTTTYNSTSRPALATTTDGSGAWSVTLTAADVKALKNGQLQITASVTDSTKGVNVSAVKLPVLNLTTPVLTITDDTPGTATGQVIFYLDFSEPVTGLLLGEITVTNGTGTALTGSGSHYELAVTPSAASSGNITLSVAAGVATGTITGRNNTSATALQPFDTTGAAAAPTVSIDTSALVSDTTPLITGTCSMAAGAPVVVTVDTDNDGVAELTYSVIVQADHSWSLNLETATPVSGSLLADGVPPYSRITATATNSFGNGTSAVGLNHPTAASQLTNLDQPTVTGYWTKLTGDSLQVTVNSVTYSVGSGLTVTDTGWSLVPSVALPDGHYEAAVRVTRAAGGTSDDLSTLELEVDTQAEVTIDGGASADITGDSTPVITGTSAHVPTGTVVTLSLDVDNDGVDDLTYKTVTAADGTWSVDTGTATPFSGSFPVGGLSGPVNLTASLTDQAQNHAADTQALHVDVTPPIIALTFSSKTSDTTPWITGTTDLPAGSLITVNIDPDNNGDWSDVQTYVATVQLGGLWSVEATTPLSGTVGVRAAGTDAMGNIATTGVKPLEIVLNAPSLAIDSPLPSIGVDDLADENEDDAIVIRGQTAHLAAGTQVSVTLTDGSFTISDITTVLADGSWLLSPLNLSGMANGTITVEATAIDTDGASYVDTYAFEHDKTAPITIDEISLDTGVIADFVTKDDTIAVSGGAGPSEAVSVEISDLGNAVVASFAVTSDASGHWSTPSSAHLDPGSYTIRATASGGTTTHSLTVVDSTPPLLSSSSPADDATGVPTTADITLTFSKNIQAGAGFLSLYRGDDTLLENFNVATGLGDQGGTLQFNGTTGVVLNPFADLVDGTSYYIRTDSTAVMDTAGNAYAGIADASILNFVVGGDTTPPVITGPSGGPGDPTSVVDIDENTTAATTFAADEGVTWSIVGGNDQGFFSIDHDSGALSFDAAPDFELPQDNGANNTYLVTVRATDLLGNFSEQTLTVTVRNVNEAPVASVVSNTSVLVGSALTPIVVPAFSDPDGDTLSYSATLADGSALPAWLSFDANSRTFSGTPPAGTAPSTLHLKVTATDSALSAVANFDLTVSNPAAPSAGSDAVDATEAGGVSNATAGVDPSGDVLGNDTGTGVSVTLAEAGSSLTAGASTVTLGGIDVVGAHGTLHIASDGSYTYTVANADSSVEALNTGDTHTDTFTYRITDQAGQNSTAVVTITLHGTNDAPVTSSVSDGSVTVGSALTPIVVPAFSDVDNGSLTYSATLADGSALPAWLSFNPATRTFSGTPPAGTTPATLHLKVTGSDSVLSSAVTFDLTVSNPTAPVATADTDSATEAGGTSNATAGVDPSGNVLGNDTGSNVTVTLAEAGSSLTAGATTVTAGGVALTGSHGTLTLATDGSYSYAVDNADSSVEALNTGDMLTDTFTYRITDQAGQTSTAVVTITLHGANDAPVISSVSDASVTVGSALTPIVVPAFSDVDNGSLTYTATLADGSALPAWLSFNPATRTFSGTPPSGTTPGDLVIRVSATDGSLSSSILFTLSMANPTAPVASADSADATERGGVANATAGVNPSGVLLSNDSGTGLFVSDAQAGVNLTGLATTVTSGGVNIVGAHGTLTIDSTGSYTYAVNNADGAVEALNSGGSLTDSFIYRLTDQAGQHSSAVLTVTLHGANDSPVSSTVSGATVLVGSALTPIVVPAFTDVDNASLSYSATQADGSALPAWLSFNASTRTFTGTPPAGTVAEVLSLRVTATDSTSQSSLTFSLTVNTPSAPSAAGDAVSATEAGGVANGTPGLNPSGSVLVNDTGTTLTVTHAQAGSVLTGAASTVSSGGVALIGAHGTLTLSSSGAYSYVLDNADATVQALNVGGTLTDTFSYRITDQAGQTSTAVVTVTLHGANDAPVSSSVTDASVTVGSALTPIVVPAFTDLDNASLTYSATLADGSALPAWLSFNDATRTLTGTPPAGTTPSVLSLRVSATDGTLVSSTTFNLTLSNPGSPVATADSASATESGGVLNANPGVNPSGNLVANDSGSNVTVTQAQVGPVLTGGASGVAGGSVVLVGAHGSLTIASTGAYSYVVDNADAAVEALNTGDTLTDTFSYRITDQAGQNSTAVVTITLHGANDAPAAPSVSDAAGTIGLPITTITVPAFTDVDNAGLSYSATLSDGSALPAWLHFDASTRSFTGTPPSGTVPGSLLLKVTAGDGATSSSLVLTLTLSNPSQPVATSDHADATEAGGVSNGTPGLSPSGNVLGNDSGQGISVTAVQAGATLTGSALAVTSTPVVLQGEHGTLSLGPTGAYTYSINNSQGEVQALNVGDTLTDTFSYRITDLAGQTRSAVLTITLHGADDAPVTSSVSDASVTVGSALAPIVVPAFSDLDNALLTYSATLADGSALPAWLSFNATTRSFTGTPPAGTAPGLLQLRVSASDGVLTSSTDFSLAVSNPDAPHAHSDAADATEAGGVNNGTPGLNPSGNVLGNDTGAHITISSAQAGVDLNDAQRSVGNSGVTLVGSHGTLHLSANGSYTYTVNNASSSVEALNAGNTLTDSFAYRITDQAGQTSTALLTVTLHGQDDAPVVSTVSDRSLTVGSPLAPIVVPAFTDVDNASLSYVATLADGSALPAWLSFDAASRTFTGTPPAGTSPGALSILVTATGSRLSSSSAFTLTVSNPEVPKATQDSFSATEASGASNSVPGQNPAGNVLLNDSGTGISVTAAQVGSTFGGVQSGFGLAQALVLNEVTAKGLYLDGAHGTLRISSDGSFDYTVNNSDPAVEALNVGGSLTDTFVYRITDQAGQSSTAVVTFTLHGANDAPVVSVLSNPAATVGSALPRIVIPAFTDVDNSTLTYGATLADGRPLPSWLVFNPSTRSFSGTAPAGTAPGSLVIRVTGSDGQLSSSSTFSISLSNPQAPTAGADTAVATEAGGIENAQPGLSPSGNLLGNDAGAGITVTAAQAGNSLGSSASSVTAAGISLAGAHGTLVLSSNGSYTYTVNNSDPAVELLDAGDTLGDTFSYRVTDQAGQTATATITVTLRGANDLQAPIVVVTEPVVSTPAPETPAAQVPAANPLAESPTTELIITSQVVETQPLQEVSRPAEQQGFAVTVLPGGDSNLVFYRGVPDHYAEPESIVRFTIPSDAFAHTSPEAQVILHATLMDGSPLPSWLEFDRVSGEFRGIAPRNFTGELHIKVLARDSSGHQAEALFRFIVGKPKIGPQGGPGLRGQFRTMAYLAPRGDAFSLVTR